MFVSLSDDLPAASRLRRNRTGDVWCVSSNRDKVLKLLVELLGSSCKDVVVSSLRLTHLLMLKYEWRVSFATEGGVKAVLSCMQEFSSVTHVQQLALAVSTVPLLPGFCCWFCV